MRRIVPLIATLLMAALPSAAVPKRGPTCLGKPATLVGTRSDDILRGTPRADVLVGRGGDDVLLGRGGNDLLCGDGGHDDLMGVAGNDHLEGDIGLDGLFGGAGNDALNAGAEDDLLVPGPGDDHVDGGEDNTSVLDDLLVYRFSSQPVVVDLSAGSATGEGSDRLSGIEDVFGSDHSDVITGDSATRAPVDERHMEGGLGNDLLSGMDGEDFFLPGPGDDRVDGGPGRDDVDFAGSPSPVHVDLAAGTATGEGADRIAAVEAVGGSRFDDRLEGDDASNSLYGDLGADTILGRGETDFLSGGGDEGDTLDGGPGHDICASEDTNKTSCEGDPPSFSKWYGGPFFVTPWPRQSLDNESLSQLNGVVRRAYLHAPDGLRLGIRRLTPQGCHWWDGNRLTRQSCENPLWLKPHWKANRESGTNHGGPWSYRLRDDLPAGWYELRLLFLYDETADDGVNGSAEFRLT